MKNVFGPSIQYLSFIALIVVVSGFLAPIQVSEKQQVVDPPQYIQKAMQWLVSAQYDNGGWGAGMHTAQDIRDPHAVQIDPATTAFATLALIRSGNELHSGMYQKNVRKAVMLMLEIVENSPENDARITTVNGTQPQVKLGQNIDASMVAQLLTQVLPMTENKPRLRERVSKALDKCARKLQRAQNEDGSTANGGWAGVLQSAMATSAMEEAKAAGADIDEEVLRKARQYQQDNIDVSTGSVRTEDAAGISLYAVSASQRAAAPVAQAAKDQIEKAKKEGRLEADAEVSLKNLEKVVGDDVEAEELYNGYRQSEIALEMLNDDDVLSGFGNNGGEEFLSYMMTSESLVDTDIDEWRMWTGKMDNRFQKIQNPDGSWSGHHCITSPVFSTAAVILTVMAENKIR